MNSLCIIAALLAVAHAAPAHDRIINGKPADISDYPYQLSLQKSGSHFCGGSIISVKYAISAAHCQDAYDDQLNLLTAVAGITSLTNAAGTTGKEQSRGMGSWIRHPGYIPGDSVINYDYSIIAVTEDFDFNAYVDAVRYATNNDITYAGVEGTTSGWGLVAKGPLGISGTRTDILQEAQLTIISNDDCAVKWGGTATITEYMLCAGGTGGSGSCNGDSGGPIVIYETDGTPTLVGDVSFGLSTCSTSYPTVYGRISAVAKWISDNTQ